jgi:hypothetical protein
MLRKALLGILKVDQSGQRVSLDQYLELKQQRLQDIYDFCDIALRLRYSQVVAELFTQDGTVEIEFYLCETQQPPLEIDYVNDIISLGQDGFFEEYEQLQMELADAPANLQIATSPALTREQLRGESLDARVLRLFRKAERERTPQLVELPGRNGPTRLNIQRVPRFFSTGVEREIVATVKDIQGKCALLHMTRPYAKEDIKDFGADLPGEMLGRRQIYGPAAKMGTLLLESCDHRMPILLKVVLLDSWEDGKHCMVDILTARPLVEPPTPKKRRSKF